VIDSTTGKNRIAILVLKVLLVLVFLTIGAGKLTASLGTVSWFAQLGWGQWFRYFTGLLDIAGALLLLVPRWTCYGALVPACTIGTATVLNVLFSLHQNPLVPLMLTLLAATLAWLTRPRRGMLRGVTGI
jgi:uncharacterized membrane protein YphA (DoxX/SURF4 family)